MRGGWRIVGFAALGIAAMIAVILAVAGAGEAGIRMVIRATARTSVALFSLAFAASALQRTWPTTTSRWLLRNRRYLGVSFAVSHLFHLLAILALVRWSAGRPALVTAVLGGIGYVFVAAMAATSFDRTAAWLGPRRWKQLHTVGGYYLWLIFFLSFAPRALSSLLYTPFALALLAVLVLRLRARAPRQAAVGLTEA